MMKINSKFRDYYDSALSSFMESDVVFNRNPEVLVFSLVDLPSLGEDFNGLLSSTKSYLKDNPYLTKFMFGRDQLYTFWLGFCGEYYPFVTFGRHIAELVRSDYDRAVLNDPAKYYKLSDFFYKMDIWNTERTDFETVKKYSKYGLDFCRTIGVRMSDKYCKFDCKNPKETEFWKDEAFNKFGPIFIAIFPVQTKYISDSDKRRIWIFKNPCLKDIGFQRYMDPFTTLWTIENWIDQHARPDDAVVPVGDDITRLQAYGFDKKTSFRKMKEKK